MAFGSFIPDNIKQLQEKQNALKKLENISNTWVSPDISIEKTTVVNPGQLTRGVNIVLGKKDLPPVDITRGAIGSLAWSMRSYLAQSGVEIRFHCSSITDNMLKELNEGKNIFVPVDIINYGQRAVELDGTVMRFFWVNDRNRLRGEDLVNVIKSGEFTVGGVEGEDWFLGGSEPEDKIMTNEKNSKNGLCVVLKIEPQRFYIPPADEPVRIRNSRKDLPQFLKPIPDGMNLNFEIRETPRIKLGPNIVAVINMGAEKGQRHIYSPFIDPGSEGKIRLEILNDMKYVDFFLYKK